MKKLSSIQLKKVSEISVAFGINSILTQPDSIACDISHINKPVDYIKDSLKNTGIKISVNLQDRLICFYI